MAFKNFLTKGFTLFSLVVLFPSLHLTAAEPKRREVLRFGMIGRRKKEDRDHG
jgi:hypothetical protein